MSLVLAIAIGGLLGWWLSETFNNKIFVIAALRGEDWVEVGPFRGQVALEELEERRPGATSRVSWDDPPRLLPLVQRLRRGPPATS